MKIILDKSGFEHRIWTLSKTSDCLCPGIEAEVGTNGKQGGDAGHGGRTYFRLTLPDTFTTFQVNLDRSEDGTYTFEVLAGGDWELEMMTELLSFAGAALKELTKASAALEEHLK